MSRWDGLPVERTPGVMAGALCVRGSRLMVLDILGAAQVGGAETACECWPWLSRETVDAVLAWASANPREVDKDFGPEEQWRRLPREDRRTVLRALARQRHTAATWSRAEKRARARGNCSDHGRALAAASEAQVAALDVVLAMLRSAERGDK